MKIALINGSPKAKNSASAYVLQTLIHLLPDEYEMTDYHCKVSALGNDDLEQISKCNVLVFAFPLYVDGIPSQLLNCLYQMEAFFKIKQTEKKKVYALVNSGFYEGNQNAIALEIMKNWCEKANLSWGQGIGIGGGGMYAMLASVPDGQGPKRNLSAALNTLATSIITGESADDIFISPNLPRFAYKLGAEMGWRRQIKANGLKRKELSIKR